MRRRLHTFGPARDGSASTSSSTCIPGGWWAPHELSKKQAQVAYLIPRDRQQLTHTNDNGGKPDVDEDEFNVDGEASLVISKREAVERSFRCPACVKR